MIYDDNCISYHFEVWALNKSNPDLHLDLLFSCIDFTQLWRLNAFLLAIPRTTKTMSACYWSRKSYKNVTPLLVSNLKYLYKSYLYSKSSLYWPL